MTYEIKLLSRKYEEFSDLKSFEVRRKYGYLMMLLLIRQFNLFQLTNIAHARRNVPISGTIAMNSTQPYSCIEELWNIWMIVMEIQMLDLSKRILRFDIASVVHNYYATLSFITNSYRIATYKVC